MMLACERVRGDGRAAAPAAVVESRAMRELYARAKRAAGGSENVLIVGEAGSGKKLLAEGLHRLSRRGDQPLVTVSCGGRGEAALEAELFGAERGALADAPAGQVGALEAAAGGTLLLDDVGELPLALQEKLLVALANRQVLRVGGTRPRPLDVRCVAVTGRDLAEEVAEKRFRQDLLVRLAGATLDVPPLRDRNEDVATLARLFLKRFGSLGHSAPALAPEALALMRAYAWPGNVAELRNVVERAAVLCTDGTITEAHLPAQRMRRSAWPVVPSPETRPVHGPGAVAAARDPHAREREAMTDALRRCHGNPTRAAELMDMPRARFVELMAEYGIGRV
jgi:DNA-binding NtrC family response regulator